MATARSPRIKPENLQTLHGEALTRLLASACLTQVGLSRKSGISRKEINDYIGGNVIPMVRNLSRVLNALDATLLDYAAALYAAARAAASSETGDGSWIAQPGAPGVSQLTGGDASYGTEPRHLYFLQSTPMQHVMLFEAGPPERVLQAIQEVLGRKQ